MSYNTFSAVELHAAAVAHKKNAGTYHLSIKMLQKNIFKTENATAFNGLISGSHKKISLHGDFGSGVSVVTLINRGGVVYAYVGSNFEFAFFVTDDMLLVPVSRKGYKDAPKTSIDELVNSNVVTKVAVPLVARGVDLTFMQQEVLRMENLKVLFDYGDNLAARADLFEFDGVYFFRDHFVSFKKNLLPKRGMRVENAMGSDELFVSDKFPLEAQVLSLKTASVSAVSPEFSTTRWRNKVVVPDSETSTKLTRKFYTEVFCSLESESLPLSMKRVFNVVSFCAETIESAKVWHDPEFSRVAPKLDGFAEAGSILSSLHSLWTLYSDLLDLKGVVSKDSFKDRMNVIMTSVHALSVRTCSFIDYTAELDRLSKLVVRKNELAEKISADLAIANKLSAWDAAASDVIGDSVQNQFAAKVNSEMAVILSELSADINGRIAYLASIKERQSLLSA